MSKRKAEEPPYQNPKKQKLIQSQEEPVKRIIQFHNNNPTKRPRLSPILAIITRLVAHYKGSKERQEHSRRVFWFYQ